MMSIGIKTTVDYEWVEEFFFLGISEYRIGER